MSSQNVIPFKSLGSKKGSNSTRSNIIDHGNIGSLEYEVFSRGVIHIIDKKSKLTFKKSCSLFEDDLEKISFDKMSAGDTRVLLGSGDNCDLIFTSNGEDIKLSLKKKEFSVITNLKNLLKKGKGK